MSNTPTESEFDKALRDILFNASGGVSDMAEKEIMAIKQAFDKNILKDHQIPDGREIWDYLRIANEEHKEQRINLYGGDKK
ncbi:hypothetical protein [Rhodococcus erythropolis]